MQGEHLATLEAVILAYAPGTNVSKGPPFGSKTATVPLAAVPFTSFLGAVTTQTGTDGSYRATFNMCIERK